MRECGDTDLTGGVPTGERVFDGATVNDKIALMHEVLSALLIADTPAPKVTSTLEAAAFFPFALLIQDIECEIENEEMEIFEDSDADLKYLFRTLTWEALTILELPHMIQMDIEEGYDGQLFLDGYRSTDLSDWQEIVHILETRFFDDYDWTFTSQYPQLLDGMEDYLSNELGIDHQYFNNRLPRISDEGAEALYRQIQQWPIANQKK